MNKRLYHLDFLRIFSMFAVVFLHTVSDILRINYNQPVWHFSNVLTALLSTSVPIFFMISGALMLSDERNEDVSFVLKHRLKKICVPFLFWSVVAILYFFVIGYVIYDKFNFAGIITRLKQLPAQPVTIHFWFMYALIPIYALIPFIKILINNMKRQHKIYLFALWCFVSIFLTTASNFVTADYKMIFTLDDKYSLNIMGGYLGFFILGYYLNKKDIKIKSKWLVLYILTDVITVSAGTFVLTRISGGYFEGFKTYTGFFVSTMAVAMFLLFKNIFVAKNDIKCKKAVIFIGDTSFVIYLVHNLVIHFMNTNYLIVPNISILNICLRFAIVYIISLAITVILKHIKPMCFLATGTKYKK